MSSRARLATAAAIFALALSLAPSAVAQHNLLTAPVFPRSTARPPYGVVYPEQRSIEYRDPGALPLVPLPPTSQPPTVSSPQPGASRGLTLDEAIRIALANDRVVRVLAGETAVASGRTVYDTAIVNTTIDEQLGFFDPVLRINQSWDRFEPPSAIFVDPLDPSQGSIIRSVRTDSYNLDAAITKNNPLGGQWSLGLNALEQRFQPGAFPLNPQTTTSATLGYTQPLLRGFGPRVNLAPVVLARIDTERSFFQLKDALQEQVRGVVEAYWNLVAARVDAWARARQVEQADFAFRLASGRFRVGIASAADVAQARVTLAQFRALQVAADAAVLQREAALRNILGLPVWDEVQLVPTSEPLLERMEFDWPLLVDLAAQRRPDLVELKLILEADEQQLLIANNLALPQLDFVGLYRWNGLEGETPDNMFLQTASGQFTGWTLGVNFAVPLGLRSDRARLRQRELILARDRANLEQGLFAASHRLATTVRNLDRAYEQYLAFKEAHEAASINLNQQMAEYRNDRVIFLNVLVALTNWGDAITSEANAAAAYNTLLATLEQETGTILESHGVRFYEERYGSIGPLGRLAAPVCYPQATPPTPNFDRYPAGEQPAENVFNLQDPVGFRIRPPANAPPAVGPGGETLPLETLPAPNGLRN
jgi:outer membrane protein TolC